MVDNYFVQFISIHVTAKVTTFSDITNKTYGHNFNPRHREGDDPWPSRNYRHLGDFNPRHREGDDHHLMDNRSVFLYFNPRHREGDDNYKYTANIEDMISIHVTAKVTTLQETPRVAVI